MNIISKEDFLRLMIDLQAIITEQGSPLMTYYNLGTVDYNDVINSKLLELGFTKEEIEAAEQAKIDEENIIIANLQD